MAIDTRQRRASALDYGVPSWSMAAPDSSVAVEDRADLVGAYSGLYASGSTVSPSVLALSTSFLAPTVEGLTSPSLFAAGSVGFLAPTVLSRPGVGILRAFPRKRRLRVGDTSTLLRSKLVSKGGRSTDLSEASGVTITLLKPYSGVTVIDGRACSVLDASNGIVVVRLVATDVDDSGVFLARYKVDWGGGAYSIYPSDGFQVLFISTSSIGG